MPIFNLMDVSFASRAGGNAGWGRAREFGDADDATEISRPTFGEGRANSVRHRIPLPDSDRNSPEICFVPR